MWKNVYIYTRIHIYIIYIEMYVYVSQMLTTILVKQNFKYLSLDIKIWV